MCQPTTTTTNVAPMDEPSSKRKVTFNKQCRCRPIPMLSTFSDEEIEATWYDHTETETMVELAKVLVFEAEESPERRRHEF